MQAHAQLSGKGPGQVAGPLAGVSQQNMNSSPLQKGWRRTWQTDADFAVRRRILEKILLLFQKCKPRDWPHKLPDFVRRLEESLYWDASSKDEYNDLSTLEHRLRAVAKRILPPRNNPNFAACGINSSSSTMIPTPGMQFALNGSTMIPTPGNDINAMPTAGNAHINTNSMGTGHMLPSNSCTAMVQGHGMASAGHIGNMVPTPGNGTHLLTNVDPAVGISGNSMVTPQGKAPINLGQNVQIVPNTGIASGGNQIMPSPGLNPSHVGSNANSLAGLAYLNADTSGAIQLQPQRYNSGSSGHMYQNMNGQLRGSMAANIHRKNPSSFGFVTGGTSNAVQLMGNGQHLVNGHPSVSNAAVYRNTAQCGNMSVQSQQHMNHHRQQHISMQCDGYAMNGADIAGPGSLYSAISTGVPGNNLGMHSQGMQTYKMIPVPNLPSQSSNMQSQHQPMQPKSQAPDNFQQRNFQKNTSELSSDQQQQQLPRAETFHRAQISPKLYTQNQADMGLHQEQTQAIPGSLSSLTPLFQTSPEQQQSHHLQHTQTLPDQQQLHASCQQTATPILQQQSQQQVAQQTQNASQQQLWHPQVQSNQDHQRICKPEQNHQQLQHQLLSQPQEHHLSEDQHYYHPHKQQHDSRQHPVQQESQQQTFQGLQSSQQTNIQQSLQVSRQQFQQQGLVSLDEAEDRDDASHQVAVGSATVQQELNCIGATTLNASTTISADGQRAQQYLKQQRWLLILRHASKCIAIEGQCQAMPHCHSVRQLWVHIIKCTNRECQHPRCHASKMLIRHYQRCNDTQCPVCVPVRKKLIQQ